MHRPALRQRLLHLAGAVVIAAAALPAAAQEWPVRPVRLVVPFAPGGSGDVFGRFIAQRLQDALGQNVVVENRPGGAAIVGTDAVARSAPDGYTLLLMSNTHTANESLIPNKPYQLMRDFVAVAPINASDLVLVARSSLPAKTLPEVLRSAQDTPDGMTYASSGPGTPYHLAGELLKSMAGVRMVHVPYKGSAGARTDVLGGQVDMMFDAIPTMAEQVKAGKVRALAVTGRARSSILPEVPTVSEAGVPGYEATIWLGVMAPRGTPAPIVSRLHAEISRITANAEVRRAWAAQGTSAMSMSLEEFTRFIDDDIAKWARVVKAANIKPE
jgi:tripartite-type tricarboxylate transporter receptor subunit TctC